MGNWIEPMTIRTLSKNGKIWGGVGFTDIIAVQKELKKDNIDIGNNFKIIGMDAIFINHDVKIGMNVTFKQTDGWVERANVVISSGTIIGDDCSFEHETHFGYNCILGNNIKVDCRCTFDSEVLIGSNVIIERCCKIIDNSIIGNNVTIGVGSEIYNSIIADNVLIGNHVKLKNCKIDKYSIIENYVNMISNKITI
ncbi:MAG: hypothetical protein EBZ58_07985 [Bacteroidetes bacterium]|jgi:UDP-3-O-[3-hydroxymyristoyl] glucosamine N-acyltransferase|nr:hypothetical protein [Bacteroidota bacterium]